MKLLLIKKLINYREREREREEEEEEEEEEEKKEKSILLFYWKIWGW